MISLPSIKTLTAPNPSPMTLSGTNTYILGEKDLIIIDPGPLIESHLKKILEIIQEKEKVKLILLTHHHLDHSEGAEWLSEKTEAPVGAYKNLKLNPNLEWVKLGDQDLLKGDSFTLQVLHTPGHTSDHICLFLTETQALFSGDLILGEGSTTLNPPDGNLKDYMESLYFLKDLNPEVLFPGHGPSGNAGKRIQELIQHRKQRHQEILDCLQKGITEPEEIVQIVYKNLNPSLLGPAVGNVKAHLDTIQHGEKFFK